ncbi:uncharacterized protein M6B38_270180 [Iris pallida]|uniref:DUF6821 domain-containing protein n=1 Tax=Iris pallida TaxID=29817 RepID=A0AAX6I8L9_IRIPA|nr:uncharacterized protein M6B38_270180 [Iris pallida]
MEEACTGMDTEDWELLPVPNDSRNVSELGPEEADSAFVDDRHFSPPSQPSENQELVEKEGTGEEEEHVDHDDKEKPCREGLGLKAWSWKLAGGVGAAAAVCALAALGGRQQPCRRGPRFQIYTEDEKRIKQAVQQATRLNRALTAVRGAPVASTRADLSFGGYYDGL